MKRYIVFLMIPLVLNACANPQWQQRTEVKEVGIKSYVDETDAKERLTVIQGVEMRQNGALVIRSTRYVYGEEKSAPVMRTTTASTLAGNPVNTLAVIALTGGIALFSPKFVKNGLFGETQNEKTVGESMDKSQARKTGSLRWHEVDTGRITLLVKIGNLPPQELKAYVGLDLTAQDTALNSLKGGTAKVTVYCEECAEFIPPELIAQIPSASAVTPLGKEVQVSFDLNAYRLSIKQNAEAAKQAEVQRKHDERQAEIDARKARAQQEKEQRESAKRAQQEQARIARDGDGSADDRTCQKYGFKPSSQGYASCRMQIDQARQQLAQQQAQQQAAYEAQRQQYEEAKAERDKERKRQQGLKMMELGLGIASGKYNQSNAYGALPPAPTPPSNQPLRTTIQMPNGRFMHCETRGNDTFCF